jgi:hypothetical protein
MRQSISARQRLGPQAGAAVELEHNSALADRRDRENRDWILAQALHALDPVRRHRWLQSIFVEDTAAVESAPPAAVLIIPI